MFRDLNTRYELEHVPSFGWKVWYPRKDGSKAMVARIDAPLVRANTLRVTFRGGYAAWLSPEEAVSRVNAFGHSAFPPEEP